jgi:hypothetical protein
VDARSREASGRETSGTKVFERDFDGAATTDSGKDSTLISRFNATAPSFRGGADATDGPEPAVGAGETVVRVVSRSVPTADRGEMASSGDGNFWMTFSSSWFVRVAFDCIIGT